MCDDTGGPPTLPALRPRDAATLILLRPAGGAPEVLMGRRSRGHVFMPGRFVFPGGRTDPADSRLALRSDLPQADILRVARAGPVRARAIAVSAIRETYEEAGVLIGRPGRFSPRGDGWLRAFAAHGVVPAIDGLRLVARALTPTGQPRRFDTRFFAAWTSSVGATLPEGGPTKELEDLRWVSLPKARELDPPEITAMVLDDLDARLRVDPALSPGVAIPLYRFPRNRVARVML